ncbi:MAG: hypothetical protein JWM78_2766 [Verrucomicrobiaceae bacterium]|nr:hypothetical protein [Verrucomicrobiaceae bacterium]
MSSYRLLSMSVICVILGGCVSSPSQDGHRGGVSPSVPTTSAPPINSVPPAVKETPSAPRTLSAPTAPTSGGVSHYQDRQEQQLRERIEGTGIRASRSGDTIKLTLPVNAAFANTADQLQPRFVDALSSVAAVLREYSKTVVDIKGYTDSTGSFEHNQQISGQRAQTVGGLLISRQIAATRIRTAGYGPRYPVADNKTDAGRVQNRRIEIDLVPTP